MSNARKWFHVATIIGVLINILGMALPFIFAPQWFLDWLHLPGGGGSVIWMRQAGLLLLLISILYLPGGRDPFRYHLNAKFSILVRMTIGLYWLWLVYGDGQTRSFLRFGILDTTYAILSAWLYWRVIREETPAGAAAQLGRA